MFPLLAVTGPERRTFSEWFTSYEGADAASFSMIEEQVACVPRSWPADAVQRWAAVIRGMSPKERIRFRVRAWNSIGPSAWSAPSIQIKTVGAWCIK